MMTRVVVWCLLGMSLACSGSDPSSRRASPTEADAGGAPDQAPGAAAGEGAPSTTRISLVPVQQTAASTPTTPSDDLAREEACAGIAEMAQNAAPPADIIIAVDSTSSMTAETMFVQTQLNAFTQRIVDAMVDVRLILICEKPGTFVQNPICIPPPLAGANCEDAEPRFKHIDQPVGNHDAWAQIIATYPQYQHLLRPTAQKHIVVISDDAPGMPRASFDQMLKRVDPQFEGYRHHAIYAFTFPGEAPLCNGSGDPCCGMADGDGSDYGRLCDDTQGIKGNLCLQDFERVWDELATNVTDSTELACDWEIPPPPAGQTLDPQRVNVHYSGEGLAPQLIGWVQDSDACAANGGWFYDDNQLPTRVYACPQTCSTIRQYSRARVDITFGCKRCAGLDVMCGGDPPPEPPELK